VRRRLVQVLRRANETADDDRLYRQALALGLERSDAAVRRRLIQRLRAQIAAEGCNGAAPSPATAATEETPAEPGLRLTHVFVSRTRWGEGVEAEAARVLAILRSDTSAAPDGRGDPSPAGNDIRASGRADLARWFGPAFASQAMHLPERQWAGPLWSPYGAHLVWIHERRDPGGAARDGSARDGQSSATEARLRARCRDRAVRAALKAMRQEQHVIVEGST
jgi:hypothetical protein